MIINDYDTKTVAENWKLTERTVAKYCREGYIPGAIKIDNKWRIPANSIKPPTKDTINKLLILVNTLKHKPSLEIDFKALNVQPEELAAIYRYLTLIKFLNIIPDDIAEIRIPYEATLTDRGLDTIFSLKERDKKTYIDEQRFTETLSKWGPALISLAKAIIELAAA